MSWDDWSAVNAPPIVEDEKWHVALAPGEVKVVSLEQLDDLFRLSIVDAETKVWQNGMSEWQPLRVIAGLDDAPVAEPKRTHPKPPSPRSAPPPPRRQSVAPAPSLRPTPLPPRPQSVAPAPVVPEPFGLAATQPAFVAPIAVAPKASVRPLIVSVRAPEARRGGGVGRLLIALSLVAGVGVSLYRNGVLRDVAQSIHQESLFTRLENALGGPAFGTVRAIEQHSDGSNLTSDLNASLVADVPTRTEHDSSNAPAQTPVVSLESLEREKPGAAKPKLEAAIAASPAPAAPKRAAQPNFVATPQAKAAPVKAAVVGPAVPPKKPASEMSERERLNAAVGQSMLAAPAKSKSSKPFKASEYDPLNPKL